jgi:SAM-dependent methyltransferase
MAEGLPSQQHNLDYWAHGDFVGEYARAELTPAELRVLSSYPETRGRVLELGCGAGRLIGHLIATATDVHGLDISARMVDFCRARYPGGEYRQGDVRDLSGYPGESFDAVFAIGNLLDVFHGADRESTLAEIHRLLKPRAVLVISSHNRHFVPRVPTPTTFLFRKPGAIARAVVRFPRRYRNHRALAPLQRFAPDYAIVNDSAHDFGLLHYYITPAAQIEQLEGHGYECVEVLDPAGDALGPGDTAERSAQLYYVARRR